MSSSPKALLIFQATRDFYRSPLYSEDEIYCSPDVHTDFRNPACRQVQVPEGTFDIARLEDQLPAGWKPDLIVVKVDATQRLMPSNLKHFRVPTVLIAGDTHHQPTPIRRLINYVYREDYDIIIGEHDRHHLHYFRKSGHPRTYWMPALNLHDHVETLVEAPASPITFFGQVGVHHPYRRALVSRLRPLGLTLGKGDQREAARAYANASLAFNCSLNGDLNLRVFEVQFAGGCLLTDRLSKESGLYHLFEEGRHLLLYDSLEELPELVAHHLREPEKLLAIRKQAQAHMLSEFSAEQTRARFLDLVFEGREYDRFRLDDARVQVRVESAELSRQIPLYEQIQELHLKLGALRILIREDVRGLVEDTLDLPRLSIETYEASKLLTASLHSPPLGDQRRAVGSATVLVITAQDEAMLRAALLAHSPAYLCLPDRQEMQADSLQDLGYACIGKDPWTFALQEPVRHLQSLQLSHSELADQRALHAFYESWSEQELNELLGKASQLKAQALEPARLERISRNRGQLTDYFELAIYYAREGRLAEAIVLLEQARLWKVAREQAGAMISRLRTHLQSHHKEALQAYQQEGEALPGPLARACRFLYSPQRRQVRAVCFSLLSEPETFRHALQQCIQIADTGLDTYLHLIVLRREETQLEAFREEVSRLPAKLPIELHALEQLQELQSVLACCNLCLLPERTQPTFTGLGELALLAGLLPLRDGQSIDFLHEPEHWQEVWEAERYPLKEETLAALSEACQHFAQLK